MDVGKSAASVGTQIKMESEESEAARSSRVCHDPLKTSKAEPSTYDDTLIEQDSAYIPAGVCSPDAACAVKQEVDVGPTVLQPTELQYTPMPPKLDPVKEILPRYIVMADSKRERLLKKRVAERLRKAKIKSDPGLYASQKERDRQRYHEKKKEGIIKPLSQLNSRQQKILRERSRISSNKYYLKKKEEKPKCLEEDLIYPPEVNNDTYDPLVDSQRLLKKRVAERLRKAKIKSDPGLYARYKERDRQRYHKKKKEGIIKPLSQLNPRQQRILRERSRISSNKYNLKKKEEKPKCLEEDLIYAPEVNNDTYDPLVDSQPQPKGSRPRELIPLIKSSLPNQENYFSPMTSLSGISSTTMRRLRSYQESPEPLSPSSDASTVSRLCNRSPALFTEMDRPSTPKAKHLNPKVIIRKLKYSLNKMSALQKENDKLKAINERYRKEIYRLKKQRAVIRKP